MDDHVHTLFLAIKDELPSAYTLVNALADISDPIAKYLDLPYWADMLAKWRPYYDIVGLDMYPNRLSPLPFFKDTVATTIKTALNNQFLAAHHGVNHSFEQAPVWVLETGYPVWITTPTYYPASVNFTQQLQASYFQFFMETADAAGEYKALVLSFMSADLPTAISLLLFCCLNLLAMQAQRVSLCLGLGKAALK